MHLLRLFFFVGMLFLEVSTFAALDSGTSAIQNAASKNKSLLIFFYKERNEKTAKFEKIFDQAINRLGIEVESIKINANDTVEKPIIEKFKLKRTPMPFVLILTPNGAVIGGFSSFTEEQLVNSITSKGAAQCLKALQDRKLVLLCLQNNRTSHNEGALSGVKEFKEDSRFGNATEIVVIDPSDVQEQKFLKQLGLDLTSSQALTVLISPPAEIISTYKGFVTKNKLIADLQNATSGCCGAGGCCPGGCCPGGKCGPCK